MSKIHGIEFLIHHATFPILTYVGGKKKKTIAKKQIYVEQEFPSSSKKFKI